MDGVFGVGVTVGVVAGYWGMRRLIVRRRCRMCEGWGELAMLEGHRTVVCQWCEGTGKTR